MTDSSAMTTYKPTLLCLGAVMAFVAAGVLMILFGA